MDFRLDEDLVALQGLAAEILTDRADTDRLREVEVSGSRLDEELWAELATAGLLGLVVPEEHGGAGLLGNRLAALGVVLEEQGRHVAPVPLWSAGVATLAVVVHGTEAQRTTLLPGCADGSRRIALALEEYGAEPAAPTCRAVPEEGGWRLTGAKAAVPTPYGAGHVLVSATTDTGTGVFLVDTSADGVIWETSETTTYDLAGNLTLTAAPAEALGGPDTLGWLLRHAAVALAAVQVGVADGAMRLAATYLAEREQFGRPLGTFQAVAHQLADCWIDIDAMRVTLWQAIGDLEEDRPAARRTALVAKWWCDQGGLDVVHRVQHLHGGIGVDVDYPVHRHFLWGKQISTTLGGSAATLADLGDVLADEEVSS